jgi:hypothetical protein
MEASHLSRVKAIGRTTWVDPRVMKGLIDVDIAETRYHLLIEQDGFDGDAPPHESCGKRLAVEGDLIDALWTETKGVQGRTDAGAWHEPPPAKLAKIAVIGDGAFVEGECQVCRRVWKWAGWFWRRMPGDDPFPIVSDNGELPRQFEVRQRAHIA